MWVEDMAFFKLIVQSQDVCNFAEELNSDPHNLVQIFIKPFCHTVS